LAVKLNGQRCRISYKNAVYERLHSNIKIYQYQEITPRMAVAAVSMQYAKVNFKASDNFLSEHNVNDVISVTDN